MCPCATPCVTPCVAPCVSPCGPVWLFQCVSMGLCGVIVKDYALEGRGSSERMNSHVSYQVILFPVLAVVFLLVIMAASAFAPVVSSSDLRSSSKTTVCMSDIVALRLRQQVQGDYY